MDTGDRTFGMTVQIIDFSLDSETVKRIVTKVVPLADLLLSGPSNIMLQEYERVGLPPYSRRIRWIHLPVNNMSWTQVRFLAHQMLNWIGWWFEKERYYQSLRRTRGQSGSWIDIEAGYLDKTTASKFRIWVSQCWSYEVSLPPNLYRYLNLQFILPMNSGIFLVAG
jgi:hypothetical protein